MNPKRAEHDSEASQVEYSDDRLVRSSHAYGPADDVPALLDALRPDPADDVWGELWSRICHQGTVYTASFAALPALADLAARLLPAQRSQPLSLAGAILASDGCRDDEGRDLGEIFRRQNGAVVLQLSDLTRESLARTGQAEWEFIYLLQAARAFDGDCFWGRSLDQLAGGEFTGFCPSCGVELYLVIGRYGDFATAEDWVSSDGTGNVKVREGAKLAPIEPATGTLPPAGQWMLECCVAAELTGLARSIRHLYGTSACSACNVRFEVQKALAAL